MKKIISMAMAFVMIIMLWGCAPKKTTEVAPITPSTKTDTTDIMIQKCDEILEEIDGNRVQTEVVDGRYQVIIAEPGLTTKVN